MKRLIIMAMLALPFMGAECRGAETSKFRGSVQTLESLQDAMAQGDRNAEALQSRLIAQIETDIVNTPARISGDRKTLEAVSVFLFSGGNPNIVEAHVEKPVGESNVFSGALAYARAEKKQALKHLDPLDARTLPPNIGGRVALVRAILTAGDDPGKALRDLNLARQLMPGTLIEEASLRRCVAFAGELRDAKSFEFCARRYVHRFPKSIYWPDFADSMAQGMVLLDAAPSLPNTLEALPSNQRLSLALAVSLAALNHGRIDLAKELSSWAATLAFAGSPEMARAKLYRGAALLASGSRIEAMKLLGDLGDGKLDPRDQALLAKARDIAQQIARAPVMSLEDARQLVPPPENSADEAKILGEAKSAVERAKAAP
jgi:chemotaxis protein MotC